MKRMLVVACFSASCASVHSELRTSDRFLRLEHPTTVMEGETLGGTVTQDDASLRVTAVRYRTCSQQDVRVVEQTTTEVRRTGAAHWLEYGAALVAITAGVLVTVDAGDVPDASDRLASNPVGQDGAYAIGFGTIGVGALSLGLGISDSFRARDRTIGRPEERQPVEGAIAESRCQEHDADGVTVWLVGKADGTQTPSLHSLGITDAEGNATVPLDRIPPELLTGAGWLRTANVAIGEVDAPVVVGEVALAAAHTLAADRAWGAAEQAGTSAAFRRFIDEFPAVRSSEAKQRFVSVRTIELDAAFETAMKGSDATRGRLILEEWKALAPDDAGYAARAQQVAAVAMAAAKRFLRDGRSAIKARRYEEAHLVAIQCREAAPGRPECEKLDVEADSSEASLLAKAAKVHLRKGRAYEALVSATECLSIAPELERCIEVESKARTQLTTTLMVHRKDLEKAVAQWSFAKLSTSKDEAGRPMVMYSGDHGNVMLLTLGPGNVVVSVALLLNASMDIADLLLLIGTVVKAGCPFWEPHEVGEWMSSAIQEFSTKDVASVRERRGRHLELGGAGAIISVAVSPMDTPDDLVAVAAAEAPVVALPVSGYRLVASLSSLGFRQNGEDQLKGVPRQIWEGDGLVEIQGPLDSPIRITLIVPVVDDAEIMERTTEVLDASLAELVQTSAEQESVRGWIRARWSKSGISTQVFGSMSVTVNGAVAEFPMATVTFEGQ